MNSLADPKISDLLQRLQESAQRDSERWAERSARQQQNPPASDEPDPLIRMGEFYLGVSPAEGKLLYMLARNGKARQIVEFGASYGISTLYLGAAARDNGGQLITTEVHPDKCVATRQLITDAGLDDHVTLLEGDALETLKALQDDVDLLFLDGWKGLYLPMLELIRPRLHDGSLVAADNVDHQAAQPYVEVMEAVDSGFVTTTVGDMQLSCYNG